MWNVGVVGTLRVSSGRQQGKNDKKPVRIVGVRAKHESATMPEVTNTTTQGGKRHVKVQA
jgi:hypothetical protein